jgi:hypothetical protein
MFKREAVKLPARKPDGTATRTHPLLWGLQDARDLGVTDADIARAMKVAPQTLHIWKGRAKENRNFLLPAEQVPDLSQALGIAPYFFRPDLWPSDKWRF